MTERLCLTCGIEMDYLGEKKGMFWFECPSCNERECSKDKEVEYEIEVPRLNPMYPLGGKMGYLTKKKV